jgi:hypothetical protein
MTQQSDNQGEMEEGVEFVKDGETCTAYFLGGPLDGIRTAEFYWDENYRSGNSFYVWPHWREHPTSGEAQMIGTSKYCITVMQSDSIDRLISCRYDGFSNEGLSAG